MWFTPSSQGAALIQSTPVIVVYKIKFFPNGAFQANSFIQSAPADGSAFKIYLSNNDVQASNVIATGSGLTKFFANGQIQANNLIHS
jgi:hypothetical protein